MVNQHKLSHTTVCSLQPDNQPAKHNIELASAVIGNIIYYYDMHGLLFDFLLLYYGSGSFPEKEKRGHANVVLLLNGCGLAKVGVV